MQTKFKSSRPNNRIYILRQFIWGIVAIAIWPVYKILFSHDSPNDSYYYIVGSVLIVTVVREVLRVRVVEIEFNSETQQIIFNFQNLFSQTRQKVLKFKFAKLEIDMHIGWRNDSLTIYFLSSKIEIFRVDRSKDGFSNETLRNIRDTADKLCLPISKY
ncbi:MAG TPA: hypothetical protein VF487_20475 [Chitinophagaceae bacterium]